MEDKLTIKHKEPDLLLMLREYALMFSGWSVIINLGWLGLEGVTLLVFIYGPSSLDESQNMLLRIWAFLNAFFLFIGGGLLFIVLVSPLLARLILPLVIMVLEVPRWVLFFCQLLTDGLTDVIIKSGMYPE